MYASKKCLHAAQSYTYKMKISHKSMWAGTINCESTLPGLIALIFFLHFTSIFVHCCHHWRISCDCYTINICCHGNYDSHFEKVLLWKCVSQQKNRVSNYMWLLGKSKLYTVLATYCIAVSPTLYGILSISITTAVYTMQECGGFVNACPK